MMQAVVASGDGSVVLPCSTATTSSSFTFGSPPYLYNRHVSAIHDSNFKSCRSFCIPKLGIKPEKRIRRGLMVRASGSSNDNIMPNAPLEFESPSGQVLAQILQTHPHLLPSAIDQQIENLLADRDSLKQEAPPPTPDMLQRRIAEVREKERHKTLEEIIYCVIVQKFMDNNISMIPPLSVPSDPIGRVDSWPNQEEKLESVHSTEAFEMIQSHLSLVLGERERLVGPLDTLVHISKLKLGKLYAASIMYGYFLRRVDQRFQLERSMNTLPEGFDEGQVIYNDPTPKNQLWDAGSLIRIPDVFDDGEGLFDSSSESKSYKLRSYVMYLDAETLQRYATIRSKEAVSLIERQTQALFGRPDVRIAEDGSLDASNDEAVEISFSGLTMLILEAVAFGSFLWDSEGYVETKYPFLKS